jgi:hypothetical protein
MFHIGRRRSGGVRRLASSAARLQAAGDKLSVVKGTITTNDPTDRAQRRDDV